MQLYNVYERLSRSLGVDFLRVFECQLRYYYIIYCKHNDGNDGAWCIVKVSVVGVKTRWRIIKIKKKFNKKKQGGNETDAYNFVVYYLSFLFQNGFLPFGALYNNVFIYVYAYGICAPKLSQSHFKPEEIISRRSKKFISARWRLVLSLFGKFKSWRSTPNTFPKDRVSRNYSRIPLQHTATMVTAHAYTVPESSVPSSHNDYTIPTVYYCYHYIIIQCTHRETSTW